MNNQWESLIRAIVPLSFMAIWALTSLFNRDAKAKPVGRTTPNRPGPGSSLNPRATDPTLRWNTPNTVGASTIRPQVKRPATKVFGDDGIVILSADNNRSDRDNGGRTSLGAGTKRPSKGKPIVPPRRVEPTPAPTRPRLAGVSQNVDQHLANTAIEMPPLTALAPATAMPSLGLSSVPTLAPNSIVDLPRSAAALALGDPARLREAFLLSEILSPPVAMRGRHRDSGTR